MVLATLCYIRKDNKTLMVHRIKKQNDMHEGKWNGLGGKFEDGETPEECVIREVLEQYGHGSSVSLGSNGNSIKDKGYDFIIIPAANANAPATTFFN